MYVLCDFLWILYQKGVLQWTLFVFNLHSALFLPEKRIAVSMISRSLAARDIVGDRSKYSQGIFTYRQWFESPLGHHIDHVEH